MILGNECSTISCVPILRDAKEEVKEGEGENDEEEKGKMDKQWEKHIKGMKKKMDKKKNKNEN